jgi:hypothetical protein
VPTPDKDIDDALDAAVALLRTAVDRDWQVTAGTLDWTCWETVEHLAQLGPREPHPDTWVPITYQKTRPAGPESTIFAESRAGNAGLLRVLEACGGMLAALVHTKPESVRGYHSFGPSDPAGYAAMAVVEILVHTADIAAGLRLRWEPDPDLCDRALRRLFPDAPTDTDRWSTLLWATGRADLPGRPRPLTWRWHAEPH